MCCFSRILVLELFTVSSVLFDSNSGFRLRRWCCLVSLSACCVIDCNVRAKFSRRLSKEKSQ